MRVKALRGVVMAVLAASLGLTLAVVPTNFAPEQAHAAIAPGLPDPLNILPSIITGSKSASLAPASWLDQLAVMVAKAAKAPVFWKAVESVNAGVPNKTEADLVADVIKKFRMPAFKPQTMLKGLGGAGAALTAFDVGLWVGNGYMDLTGTDRDTGTLCTGTAGNDAATWWTSNFNHVDCAGFAAMTEAAIAAANNDVSAGVTGGESCSEGAVFSGVNSGPFCVVLLGLMTVSAGVTHVVFQVTPTPPTNTSNEIRLVTIYSDLYPGGSQQRLDKCDGYSNTSMRNLCTATYGVNTSFSNYSLEASHGGVDGFRGYLAAGSAETVPQAVENTVADPERWLECRIKLTNGANLVAESLTFKESSGVVPPVVCPEIPTGAEIDEFSVWEVGGGQSHELVPSTSTTPEYDAAKTAYPECMDGTCMLDLQKAGVSCFQVPAGCTDWFTDPDKTTSMTCRYGANLVALSECNVYAPTFKPEATATKTPYADPATGEPLPSTPGAAAPGAVADPVSPRNCFPTGWGILNPVEWVVKPIGCALEYAFVPRAEKVAELNNKSSNAWKATTLAKTVLSLEAVAPVLMGLSDGDCGGLLVDLSGVAPDLLDLGSYRFLPACPGDFFADWAFAIKAFLVIVISLGGFISVKAQVSRFASNGDA